MPYFLKLLIDNITLFNLMFGNVSLSNYLVINNIEFTEEYSTFFIQNFKIDSLNLFDIQITLDLDVQFKLERKENNLNFNDFFLSNLENDDEYFLIHKRIFLEGYQYLLRYSINDKPYDLIIFESTNFWEISIRSNSPKPKIKKLVEKETYKTGLLIQWGKEIISENPTFTIEDFINKLNAKYEYWNKDYYLESKPQDKQIKKEEEFVYSLESNEEVIWVISKKKLDKDALQKYETTGLNVLIKGDLYEINGSKELYCDEILVLNKDE